MPSVKLGALLCASALVATVGPGCLRKQATDSRASSTLLLKQPEPTPRPAPATPGVNVPAIKVNTVGYPIGWRKIAIFNMDPAGAVIKDERGSVVHKVAGEDVTRHGRDLASGDDVWRVDFSALDKPGRYLFEAGVADSHPFEITNAPYALALVASLKQFYFQRCRTELSPPHAVWEQDSYTRDTACHAHEDIAWDLMEHPEKKTRWRPDAGWHDAGNFEMYVPSTAPTAQALLMAYEAHPNTFADDQLNIPESKNGIPDLLDEARWGLRWVLSMEDPKGGFRNREAVMEWGSHGAADSDKTPRWISGVGTASTAKATAALAVAARVYRTWDEVFASRCEAAARRGWQFLQSHPKRVVVDGKGSKQPLWDDGAEHKQEGGSRLLAAAEVWKSFRDPSALTQARELLSHPQASVDEFLRGAWVNMARWGLLTLAGDPETPEGVRADAAQRIREAADKIRAIAQGDGYLVACEPSDYYWGANSNLLERTHLLLAAHRLDPSLDWALESARDQWHWILGRNPNGFSMVTRIGQGPTRMYHMEWGRKDRMPPGYLVGGPNGKEGAFLAPGAPAKALLWDNPEPISAAIPIPAHALWHAEQEALWEGGFTKRNDWSVGWWIATEGDIYYNANLVLVATEMQAGAAPPAAGESPAQNGAG